MYEGIVQDLIDELGRLPGIGPKSAQRIAFHLVQADPADVARLVQVLAEVKDKIRFCELCGNVAEATLCRICGDSRRDQTAICVVEEPKDVVAIERTREFRGRYHVLRLGVRVRLRTRIGARSACFRRELLALDELALLRVDDANPRRVHAACIAV